MWRFAAHEASVMILPRLSISSLRPRRLLKKNLQRRKLNKSRVALFAAGGYSNESRKSPALDYNRCTLQKLQRLFITAGWRRGLVAKEKHPTDRIHEQIEMIRVYTGKSAHVTHGYFRIYTYVRAQNLSPYVYRECFRLYCTYIHADIPYPRVRSSI